MPKRELSNDDYAIVLACLQCVLQSDEIEDPEFRTRIGVVREDIRKIIASWPIHEMDKMTRLAVNNCMVEVNYGIDLDERSWSRWFQVSKAEVEQTYRRWSELEFDDA